MHAKHSQEVKAAWEDGFARAQQAFKSAFEFASDVRKPSAQQ